MSLSLINSAVLTLHVFHPPDAKSHLTDSDGVVQHCLGVSGVVSAWEWGVGEMGLQQQVSLGVGAVIGVRVDLQGEILSQLAVQLVLVVSDRQL